MFQQRNTYAQSSSFFVTLAQTCTYFSCLTSFMSHIWTQERLSHDWKLRYYVFFYSFILLTVVLADDSRKPIQSIGTTITIPTLSLSSVFYLPRFSFNLLSSKIIKIFNYTVTFFLTYCVFQELGIRKMIDTGRERNGLYKLEFASDQVAFIRLLQHLNTTVRLGYPSLHVLKLRVPSLG